ncbi:hypothetical protein [Oceanimonas sp. GK1]|uniref:hypothetical protein n=1 Tax=Oceanimonas sp. (strain GK1 / IBRC-M 10197) TaxID=511062 RepID=UPI0011D233C9|nr:hypothetical protein [Oceanimonas sp. GK1]
MNGRLPAANRFFLKVSLGLPEPFRLVFPTGSLPFLAAGIHARTVFPVPVPASLPGILSAFLLLAFLASQPALLLGLTIPFPLNGTTQDQSNLSWSGFEQID